MHAIVMSAYTFLKCVCMHVVCIRAAHVPREHTSLTTMTSMDMSFPGLFYHILYVDSARTLLCTYTFLKCVHVVFSCHVKRHDYDIQGYVIPHNHVLHEDS